MDELENDDQMLRLAERIRAVCIKAAIEGYQHASISGLCGEGAFENAVSAIRVVNLTDVLKEELSSRH
jgi:hypothetical protein